MKYVVRYAKRSLLRNSVDIKTIDKEGVESITGTYNKNVLPGSIIRWRLKFDGQKGNFVLPTSQEDLTNLVGRISFFDDKGNQITSANTRNPNDPFLRHKDLFCEFIGGDALLDDENPLHEFFLKCFKYDKNFYFDGEVGMPKSALTKYIVTKAGGESRETSRAIEETLEASALLKDMSFERQCQILSSFGVNIGNKPDPIVVKNTLYNKVITQKDSTYSGRRNIERFLELARTNSTELNFRSLISDAVSKGIIFKKPGGKYYFGDVYLGRSLDNAFEYLSLMENEDIKNDIIRLVTK